MLELGLYGCHLVHGEMRGEAHQLPVWGRAAGGGSAGSEVKGDGVMMRLT